MLRVTVDRFVRIVVVWCMVLIQKSWSQSNSAPYTLTTSYAPWAPLPTTPLSSPDDSGEFTWPETTSVQLYNVGDILNISWSTTYSAVNIWAIPNYQWATPQGIIANTRESNFEWTVSCFNNCSDPVPWCVRAVNAQGDFDKQQNEGFVSAEFWIQPPPAASSSPSASVGSRFATSVAMIAAPPIATSLPASSRPTSSSSTSLTSSSSASLASDQEDTQTRTSLPATIGASVFGGGPGPASISSGQSTISPSALASSSASTRPGTTSMGNQTAIDVGVGVGVGVGVAVIGAALAGGVIARRVRRRKQDSEASPPQYPGDTKMPYEARGREPSWKAAQPAELAFQSPRLHEAPMWNQDPQELGTERW